MKNATIEDPVDSVTIIEECLTRIYQTRRSNLQAKHRKFRERSERRAYNFEPSTNKSPAKEFSAAEALSDYKDSEVLEELTTKFRAPPVISAPYQKERSRIAIQYEEESAEAERQFLYFSSELRSIIENSPMRLPDDEFRGDYADNFVQKYLSDKLDAMQPAKTVSKIRRYMSNIIEMFASSANMDPVIKALDNAISECTSEEARLEFSNRPTSSKVNNKRSNSPKGTSMASAAAMGRKNMAVSNESSKTSAASTTSMASESGPTVRNDATATMSTSSTFGGSSSSSSSSAIPVADMTVSKRTAEERKKAEQTRIKAQYEQLMNLKKKTQEANRPDEQTIEQYQTLHTDIQNVINSIQTNKQIK
mmetsp:Transcript_6915/g.11529  ORF Transcript_6915/g.11529 Transcript_6915/m.11529 type:complete len:364 (-) Transcript_6915:1438-2529(-)